MKPVLEADTTINIDTSVFADVFVDDDDLGDEELKPLNPKGKEKKNLSAMIGGDDY